MARGALLTGTAGGIIGTITAGIGVTWSIIQIQLYLEVQSYRNLYYLISLMDMLASIYNHFTYIFDALSFYLELMAYPSTPTLLLYIFSLILSILLIASGILTGVGFYGFHQAGGGAIGIV
ncbi:MAG: hypothetical protein QW279_14050, partial [Candidatus Jordarchaeaceae archaeon]